MNSILQRYGLPVVVLGFALYLGWPPAKPIDLGDDLIRARAVKWNPADLAVPNAAPDVVDPFRQVLVVKEPVQTVDEIPEQTSGPSEQEIRDVIHLTGLANIGGRTWAIVNGRARLAGDTIRTEDQEITCNVVSVHTDHIVVQCQQTLAVVRPQVSRRTKTKATAAPAVVTPVVGRGAPAPQSDAVVPPGTEASPAIATPPANAVPPTPDVGIPPQASIQNSWKAAIRVATNQL